MTDRLDTALWPLTFRETFGCDLGGEPLDRSECIQVDDIAIGGYCYPEGRIWRYKESGWKKAMKLGIAVIDVRDFGAVGDADIRE